MIEKPEKSRRYTPTERAQALARAQEIGPATAGIELGIPKGTIYNWRFDEKSVTSRVAAEEASKSPGPASQEPADKPKAVAKSYTPSLRARVLEYVAQHGVSAAAREFGVARFSIYNWQRKVELHAQGKATDHRQSYPFYKGS